MSSYYEDQDLLSQEQSILSTNRKLLSILQYQGKDLKENTTKFHPLQTIPHYRYYQNLKFNEDDLRNIASMVRILIF